MRLGRRKSDDGEEWDCCDEEHNGIGYVESKEEYDTEELSLNEILVLIPLHSACEFLTPSS